jgi:hypothetical protein
MRGKKIQINKMRNNKREVRKTTKDNFENLYSNKLENVEEMDKFLNTNDHTKLNQEGIKHLNRL